jgi:glycosyltransferase involved in cell wall biosynthesis
MAVRAALVLEQLAAHFAVSLLVVPIHGEIDAPLDRPLRRACTRVVTLEPPDAPSFAHLVRAADALQRRDATSRVAAESVPAFASGTFSVIHLYRLSALPFAAPYLAATPRAAWRIDVDEVESATRHRLADRLQRTSDPRARLARFEAGLVARVERDVLPAFARVYVCSPRELALLPHRTVARVVPNVLPDAAASRPPRPDAPFTFLFVGSLAAPANSDAILHFCEDVWPLVRAGAGRACRLSIAGAGASDALIARLRRPGVDLLGWVPDVAACYGASHAVVVPLRVGGGTRIKVLEAMRAGRPIVATSEGMAGLAAEPERHVLIGDDAETFARQCLRLMEHDALTTRLAAEARRLYERDHRPASMAAALAADLADPIESGTPCEERA